MVIHVDVIHASVWMRWYAASRSVFLVRMIIYGHLIYMDAIM